VSSMGNATRRSNTPSVRQRLLSRYRANLLAARRTTYAIGSANRPLPYFGTVGVSNLGDELVLTIAEKSFPGRVLIPVDGRRPLQRRLLRIAASDAQSMLVGGGTSILSLPLLRTLQQAVHLGLRFSTFGSGVDDPSFFGQLEPAARDAWESVFASSEEIGVRGPMSVAALHELGVTRARMVGDPAIVFAKETAPAAGGGQVLGINVGTAYGAVWGGDEESALKAVTQLATSVRRSGWSVRLFSVWPPDTAIAARIAREASLGEGSICAEYFDGRRLATALGQCDLFVGMKLHSQILATCSGVPTLAIEYQPKTSDFMSAIGSASEVVGINSVRAATLREFVEHMSMCREEIAIRQWSGCRALANRFLSYVSELGGSPDHLSRWLRSDHP